MPAGIGGRAGVAGGNGLERIDCAVTRRIVGLDINPAYLEAVRRRFAVLPGLELHCVDLGAQVVDVVPVRLVHAALIFEHAGTGRCLEHAVRMVGEGGRMSVVLQLQGREEDVAPTPYASIQALREGFRLVEPEWLCGNLRERGLRMEREERRELRGGKGFWMGVFGRR